jgi:hypothetical protein
MTKEEMIDKALKLARAGDWKGVDRFLLKIYNLPEWQSVVQAVNVYKRKLEPVRHEDLSI